MAEIRSFSGYTYNPQKVDIEDVLAPPYDVVTQEERERIIASSPYNILRLELPGEGVLSGEGPGLMGLRHTLDQWIREEVLIRDPGQSLYPYEISFDFMGRRYTRWGLICLLGVEPWEKRVILPHEKTFKKVTKERLELLKTVRAQFSQIFLLSKEKHSLVEHMRNSRGDCLLEARDHLDNLHRVYKIEDKEIIDHISALLSDEPLYIADGHHRYTTAITFMEECEREGTFSGDPSTPHRYVMAYIVDTTDPGLLCLATHRLVKAGGLGMEGIIERLDGCFETLKEPVAINGLSDVEKIAETLGDRPGFFLFHKGSGQAALMGISSEGITRLTEAGLRPPLLDLDVVSVDELAIKMAFNECAAQLKDKGVLRYEAMGSDLIEDMAHDEVLFFVRPTPVEAMIEVAQRGLIMPHKATYFYPKILTGTIIREL